MNTNTNENQGVSSPTAVELTGSEPKANKPILSFDGESDGLWGCIHAIGATVMHNGKLIDVFGQRLPKGELTNEWSINNYGIENLPVVTDEELLKNFAEFYFKHKEGSEIVTHMGYIVEARILKEMYERKLMGDFDGPYPLYDVAPMLHLLGEQPDSVDNFLGKDADPIVNGIVTEYGNGLSELIGSTHNPIYDSLVTSIVYEILMNTLGVASK